MLAFFAALLAASPSPALPATPETSAKPDAATASTAATASETGSAQPDLLLASMPWWEKITVTVDDKGTQQGCRYETSLKGSANCDKDMAESIQSSGKGTQGIFKKVTFERRFSPGAKLDSGKLAPGDTLLGRQVMFLTIDAKGAIESCKVVSSSGDSAPDYDCNAIRKERFSVDAAAARQAFMTVMAYGHTESIA